MPITVRGAREHNLRAVDLELPTGALVVFCGRSGSGKSSLAFDTLHAEGQRRYLQALGLTAEAQLQPPDADAILHLPPTLALGQRLHAPPASTPVLELAELGPSLRLLFGRSGTAHCPSCDRPVVPRTVDGIVADLMSEPDGSRLILEAPIAAGEGVLDEVARAGFSRIRWKGELARIDEVGRLEGEGDLRVVIDRIKLAPDRRSRLSDSVRLAGRAGRGVVVAWVEERERRWVDRPYCPHCDLHLPALEPRAMSARTRAGGCPACRGQGCGVCDQSRLSPAARSVRWRGRRLPELQRLSLQDLRAALALADPGPVEAACLADLNGRLQVLLELGLGALPGDRPAEALASSEVQRIRLARTVAAALGGVLYVLDEPTAGLDAAGADAVLRQLRRLADGGATVLCVEHRASVVAAAEHVVEFGPGAGTEGGRVVFEGSPEALLRADTSTGRWLSGRGVWPERAPSRHALVQRVGGLDLPVGALIALVGPAGSGKSRRLADLAASARAEGRRVFLADRPAGRSQRSMPATFVGLWDVLRSLLAQTREAQVRGLDASAFSLQSKGGRCEQCKGSGVETIGLDALPDVLVPCPVCDGRRFSADVLEVRWKGMDPAELLAADARTLRPLLAGHPKLEAGLGALVRVGLGYVPLGQGTDTLSGGEARRLTLARELAAGRPEALTLLDDPSVGLHPQDTADLMGLLGELAEQGGTVVIATHDPELAARCDHRITV